MNFGYVNDDAQLDRIDFTLPPDDPGNSAILAAGKPVPDGQRVFAGCAEYRVKEWKGVLYPEKTKETDMLHLYADQFRVMEMNGTHYKIYPPEHIAKWAAQVEGKDFLFLPKFPQIISHESHGYDELQTATAAFIESVSAFGVHLGPLFLQMSEYYRPDTRQAFFAYLASLPEGFTYFVELRHWSWFSDHHVRQELLTALRTMGIGLVITDTPGHREIVHMALTTPQVMIRFVGRHRHSSTMRRADEWMVRLKSWMDGGLERAYFIVHTGLSAPRTAAGIIPRMNEVLDAGIEPPRLAPEQDADNALFKDHYSQDNDALSE